ncbi:MAG: hypothetical protein LRZ88_10120 [Candidatus Cloacimonetes bacterium]|nr:hypothetical protein [Candidatus Cloacimonadota bacterium]
MCFGGSFHSYLAKTYGEERFAYLYQDNSSRLTAYLNGLMPSLALDPAFFNAYGRSLDTLWQEWQASEKAQAKAQTATRVTHDGWDRMILNTTMAHCILPVAMPIKPAPDAVSTSSA